MLERAPRWGICWVLLPRGLLRAGLRGAYHHKPRATSPSLRQHRGGGDGTVQGERVFGQGLGEHSHMQAPSAGMGVRMRGVDPIPPAPFRAG